MALARVWKGCDESSLTFRELEQEPTIYLIPECDTNQDRLRQQLAGWFTDATSWPQDRSLGIFCRWFEFQHHSMMVDLCDAPLIDKLVLTKINHGHDVVLANNNQANSLQGITSHRVRRTSCAPERPLLTIRLPSYGAARQHCLWLQHDFSKSIRGRYRNGKQALGFFLTVPARCFQRA